MRFDEDQNSGEVVTVLGEYRDQQTVNLAALKIHEGKSRERLVTEGETMKLELNSSTELAGIEAFMDQKNSEVHLMKQVHESPNPILSNRTEEPNRYSIPIQKPLHKDGDTSQQVSHVSIGGAPSATKMKSIGDHLDTNTSPKYTY